jgi:Uma2 family endonuclease
MLKTLRRTQAQIGPASDGSAMSLEEFDRAITEPGFNYELAGGVIQVSEIPKPEHAKEVQAVRNQFVIYQEKKPGSIELVAGSNEAKLLIAPDQSERHPDISVYTSAQPEGDDPWSFWIPAIVVEIVSTRSAKRDYEEKPSEYLSFGVREYWIVDSAKGQMTAMTRWRGGWKTRVLKASSTYRTPLLPGFSLNLKRIFAAAKRK